MRSFGFDDYEVSIRQTTNVLVRSHRQLDRSIWLKHIRRQKGSVQNAPPMPSVSRPKLPSSGNFINLRPMDQNRSLDILIQIFSGKEVLKFHILLWKDEYEFGGVQKERICGFKMKLILIGFMNSDFLHSNPSFIISIGILWIRIFSSNLFILGSFYIFQSQIANG